MGKAREHGWRYELNYKNISRMNYDLKVIEGALSTVIDPDFDQDIV